AFSRAALRDGRGQAARAGWHETPLARAPDHGVRAPGPLRERPRRAQGISTRANRTRRHPRTLRPGCQHFCFPFRPFFFKTGHRHGATMNPTQQLHDLGQSIWLDNITRGMLNDGTLAKYIAEHNVTGLTSNPSIFDKAISGGHDYDGAIADLLAKGQHGEDLFFSLALQDLTRAADMFKPAFHASDGADGFVSLEVSPLLADDTEATIESAAALHAKARRDNLFIKIPGTPAGIPAIEESIYRGVPINVTLLFSREQYLAAAEAWMRGIERRIAEGKS